MTRLAWALLAAASLSGCVNCNGGELFAAAEKGELRAIHEVGELADPVIPPPNTRALRSVDDAMELLVSKTQVDDPFARLHAFEALRRLVQRSLPRFRDRRPKLMDPFLTDRDPELRWRSAWLLGRLEIVRPQLHTMIDDADPRVAKRAVWALGRSRDKAAIPTLLKALERVETEGAAVRALQHSTRNPQIETAEAWRAWAGEQPRPATPAPTPPKSE